MWRCLKYLQLISQSYVLFVYKVSRFFQFLKWNVCILFLWALYGSASQTSLFIFTSGIIENKCDYHLELNAQDHS